MKFIIIIIIITIIIIVIVIVINMLQSDKFSEIFRLGFLPYQKMLIAWI